MEDLPQPQQEIPEPRRHRPGATGTRAALHVLAALVCAGVFSFGMRIAIFALADRLGWRAGEYAGLFVWFVPIGVVAAAAVCAQVRGWRWVAIGLWIYTGLGILSTALCGALVYSLR